MKMSHSTKINTLPLLKLEIKLSLNKQGHHPCLNMLTHTGDWDSEFILS